MAAALETVGLTRRFGGIVAANAIALRVEEGARQALIGPNGAGKTTLINLLTGVLRPDAGRIALAGRDISAMPRHRRVKAGLARTFQINQLFPQLTPLDAVYLAVAERDGAGARWWRRSGDDRQHVAEAEALLATVGLADAATTPVHVLPYGRQRLVEIALALAARPRVLLLDEPAAGVPEGEREDILRIVSALPREVSVLLIEHDMDLVFSFAERITVLVDGAVIADGPPAEIAADRRVRAAYLGEEPHG
ncbi:MAG TPA: ABC transporter ATP-binding protein [Bauldia sp.]|nr:ABC transporter ATP-binding protein [Bauldia sp.]